MDILSNFLQGEGDLSFAVIQTTLALVSSTPGLSLLSSLHSLVSTSIYELLASSKALALRIHHRLSIPHRTPQLAAELLLICKFKHCGSDMAIETTERSR